MANGQWLSVLFSDGIAHISGEDAAKVAGAHDYSYTKESAFFDFYTETVCFTGASCRYDGTVYYPLASLMDTLHIAYTWTDSTLSFFHYEGELRPNVELDIASAGLYFAEPSDIPFADIYAITPMAVVYMFTDGGSRGNFGSNSDAAGVGGYYDADGDGTEDWIVSQSWLNMICCGAGPSLQCYFHACGNTSMYYCSSLSDGLVTYRGGSSPMHSYEAYNAFTGLGFREIASHHGDLEMDDSGEYQWNETYRINGYECEPLTYEAATAFYPRLAPTPLDFEVSWDMDPQHLPFVAQILGSLSYVEAPVAYDLDDDGQQEYLLKMTDCRDNLPIGIQATVEDFDTDHLDWSGAYIYLDTCQNQATARVCSDERAEEMIYQEYLQQIEQTVREAAATSDTLPDGDYQAIFYADLLYTIDGLDYAYVDVTDYISFPDNYIRSLKVGDVIDMSRFGFGDIVVESTKIYRYGSSEEIYVDEEWHLVKSADWDFWRLASPSDMIMSYTVEQAVVVFSPDVLITDNYYRMENDAHLPRYPESIFQLMELYSSCDGLHVYFSVQAGQVSELVLYYSPVL